MPARGGLVVEVWVVEVCGWWRCLVGAVLAAVWSWLAARAGAVP